MSQLIRLTAAEEENGPEGTHVDTQISQTAVLPVSVSAFKSRNHYLCLRLKPMSIQTKKQTKTLSFFKSFFFPPVRGKDEQMLSAWTTSLTVGLLFPSVHKVGVDRQVVWHLWAPPGVCVLTPTEPPRCLMVYDEHAGGACVHSCAFITCTHPPWEPPPLPGRRSFKSGLWWRIFQLFHRQRPWSLVWPSTPPPGEDTGSFSMSTSSLLQGFWGFLYHWK